MPTPDDLCAFGDCTQPVPCEVHGRHPSQWQAPEEDDQ